MPRKGGTEINPSRLVAFIEECGEMHQKELRVLALLAFSGRYAGLKAALQF
jgi:hypothetical protein